MPIFIFPQPGGGNPLLSFLVGLATLAILVGLIIFFLPLIAGVVVAVIVLVAAFYFWGWIKRKFGLESQEERNFRKVMEDAEAFARQQYRGAGRSGTVYEREEIRITSGAPSQRRRDMKDVEDIEETPVAPKKDEQR